MTPVARALLALVALAASQGIATQPSLAQQAPPRIWNIPFGTGVDQLPDEFAMQACGSNGGPPGVALNGFEEFARCPVEPETGLREVWFSYDDIEEYFLRARRMDEEIINGSRANTLFEQLMIYSVLLDASGKVQGYRIISDPREIVARRWEADAVAQPLRNVIFGAFGWTCNDLPRIEGERPFRGQYIKELCKKDSNGRRISIETHVLLKPGQRQERAGEGLQANEFDVQVRIEVLNAALVK